MLNVCCTVCVFFYKQKTSYERRISDWSSDVCSSDLDHADIGIEARQTQGGAHHINEGGQPAPTAQPLQRPCVHDQRRRNTKRCHVGQRIVLFTEGRQIGRAHV